jgi:type IV secretory pathway VirB4 component
MYCINVDLEKQEATVYNRKTKKVAKIGTEEGAKALDDSKVNEYYAELVSDRELTLFAMKRNKDGEWYAVGHDVERDIFIMGSSKNITFDKIIEADQYLLKKRDIMTEYLRND